MQKALEAGARNPIASVGTGTYIKYTYAEVGCVIQNRGSGVLLWVLRIQDGLPVSRGIKPCPYSPACSLACPR